MQLGRWPRAAMLACGLALIAWQVLQDVLVHQLALPIVALATALIAFAEYAGSHPRHTAARVALVAFETLVFFGAIDGGLTLLRGGYDQFVSVDWLSGSPFSDYTLPALALIVVVGGTSLFGALTAFIQQQWAVLASLLAGGVLIVFEVVEVVSMDARIGDALIMALALQVFYFGVGLVIAALAGFVWIREYPRAQRLHLRPSSHTA